MNQTFFSKKEKKMNQTYPKRNDWRPLQNALEKGRLDYQQPILDNNESSLKSQLSLKCSQAHTAVVTKLLFVFFKPIPPEIRRA